MALVDGAEQASNPSPVNTAWAACARGARDDRTAARGVVGRVGFTRWRRRRVTSRRSEDQVAVATRPEEPSARRSTEPPELSTPAIPETPAVAAALRACPAPRTAGEIRTAPVRPAAWAGQFCAGPGVPR